MRPLVAGISAMLLVSCASAPPSASPGPEPGPATLGVLVMAHGGSPAWNSAVEAAVEPLRRRYPVEVALGMAERASLQEGVARLEAAGVERIAVVRLFLSGSSFLHPTEYLLGLRPDPPARFARHGSDASHEAAPPPAPIERRAHLALSREGLVESDLVGRILADRVHDLSRDPSREWVLLVAHGRGDDEDNARLIRHLEARAASVRALGGFRDIRVETLREDWPEKREAAESRIRAYVGGARERGGIAIVVPVRVFGFGPYGSVLEGLAYRHDGRGLLPHPLIAEWLRRQVERLAADTFQ